MNRDIRFRGWHPSAKVMCDFELGENNLTVVSEDGDIFTFSLDQGFPVMRFSGLKDSKGNEIWEGDIVEVTYDPASFRPLKRVHEVVFTNGAFRYRNKEHQRVVDSCIGNFAASTYQEVIGNIYETEEQEQSA